jgi:hypothetical protein
MIDTVVLRVHNISDKLHPHYNLYNYLLHKSIDGVINHQTLVSVNELAKIPKYFRKDYIEYLDSGKISTKTTYAKMFIPSSNYFCTYGMNESKDYIEFNFSVPKYLYGQNISQFVFTQYNKDFSLSYYSRIESHKDYSYYYFKKFLQTFFNDIAKDIIIDYTEVEIMRIDFCYNLIFPNKQEALHYLEMTKKISKTYERENSNKFRSGVYNKGFSLVNKSYSFKIYHKGSEFEKSDKPKLKKLNELLPRKDRFDLDYLQSVADNICRYEVTFRKERISQLYKRKVFRKDCPIFKNDFEFYKLVKRKTKDSWLQGYNKKGNPVKKSENAVKFKNKFNANERKYYHYLHNFFNRQLNFYLDVNTYDRSLLKRRGVVNYDEVKRARFDKETFNMLFDEFLKLVDEFKVKQKESNFTYLQKANAYNEQLKFFKESFKGLDSSMLSDSEKKQLKKNYIPVNKMKLLFELLNTHSLSEIKEMKLFSRTTMYRYECYLKEIGYGKETVSNEVIRASFDFNMYYDLILQNAQKFNALNSIRPMV